MVVVVTDNFSRGCIFVWVALARPQNKHRPLRGCLEDKGIGWERWWKSVKRGGLVCGESDVTTPPRKRGAGGRKTGE